MQLSGQFLKYISDSCILTRLHLTDWVRGMLVFTNLKANINFFSVAFYLSFFSLAFIAVYWMLSKKGHSTNYWNYFYFCKITVLRMYLVNMSRRHLTPTTYCVFSIILYQWTIVTITRFTGKFIGLSILCTPVFGIWHTVLHSPRRVISTIGVVL